MKNARIAASVGMLSIALIFAFLMASDLTPSLGHIPDAFHIAGHLVIFGATGWLLRPLLGNTSTLLVVLCGGVLLELVQALAVGIFFPNEALFDTGVDLVSGMIGLAVSRERSVAERLGTWLHPAILAPLGLYAIGLSALQDPRRAIAFSWSIVFCFSPAVVYWLVGVATGRYASADIRDRSRRPPLFALAVVCSLGAWAVVRMAWPGPLEEIAIGVVASVTAVTVLTTAGFKVSGHVGGALLTGVAVAPWSMRGGVVLLTAGVLLSWARVRAECHTPREVAGAWGLAVLAAIGVGLS